MIDLPQKLQEKYVKVDNINKYPLYYNKHNNETYILKDYSMNQESFLKEIQKVECNIPQIDFIFYENNKIYALTEYIKGITLTNYIEQNIINSEKTLNILIQLLKILMELESKNIIHRDIKPDNIIIKKNDNNEDIIYLIDFGISRIYRKEELKDTTQFGTEGYASPEHFGFTQTTTKSDIYSLGMTIQEMINKFKLESDELKTIVKQMTEIDSNKRPTAKESLNYLIKDNNKQKNDESKGNSKDKNKYNESNSKFENKCNEKINLFLKYVHKIKAVEYKRIPITSKVELTNPFFLFKNKYTTIFIYIFIFMLDLALISVCNEGITHIFAYEVKNVYIIKAINVFNFIVYIYVFKFLMFLNYHGYLIKVINATFNNDKEVYSPYKKLIKTIKNYIANCIASYIILLFYMIILTILSFCFYIQPA